MFRDKGNENYCKLSIYDRLNLFQLESYFDLQYNITTLPSVSKRIIFLVLNHALMIFIFHLSIKFAKSKGKPSEDECFSCGKHGHW